MKRYYERTHLRPTALLTLAVVLALAWPVYADAGEVGDDTLVTRIESMEPEAQVTFLRELEAGGRRDASLYFHLGNALFTTGSLDSAITCYRRAVEADTLHAKAWVNMGLAYDAKRQLGAARQAFEKALAIHPEDVLALCHLGYNYFSLGKVDEAIRYYQRALAIDPDSAQAHYNLGLAFADAKVFGEALVEWRRVVEIDPDGELGQTAAENVELIKTYMTLGGP